MNPASTVLLERFAVGIDLGATYSAIAYVDEHGGQHLIPNSENERLTPSVILFDGKRAVVGSVARQNAVPESEKLVDFVKREIGKSKAQFHREFDGRKYSAEELSALIVRKLRNDAEKFLGRAITDAVITVPACFNDAERTATAHAGKLAGLNVIGVINEPTAAVLACGFRQLEGKKTVLVFDLGGGALDVTIMGIADNQIRMLASKGNLQLGGKEWDDLICEWAAEVFELQHGENPMLSLDSFQDIYGRSVMAKAQLSSRESSNFNYGCNGHGIRLELTRKEFEERSRDLIEQCKMICEIGLAEAHLQPSEIDGILLVGGMTRMPSVRAMLTAFAPGVPLIDFVNPDEVVAIGAAIHANLQLLQEEDAMGTKIVPKAVRGQFSDEMGALIQVSNITTHTLGLVVWDQVLGGEKVNHMIHRSTRIPTSVTKSFGLSKDNLTSMQISVVEGESSVPTECSPLGVCEIELPPGLSRGTPVSLTYHYTESQVLEITVEAGGQQSRATLTRSTGVSEEDVVIAAAEISKIKIVQSLPASSPRVSAGGTGAASATRRPAGASTTTVTVKDVPGKTVPQPLPAHSGNRLPSATMLEERPQNRDPRAAREVIATLVILAVLGAAFWAWHFYISTKVDSLSSETHQLDLDWAALSIHLDDARGKQAHAKAFLDGARRLVEERDNDTWTSALRSIAASAGSDIELRVIHVWKKPDDSRSQLLRIECVSDGDAPRMAADRFLERLQHELEQRFQGSERCQFERLDDEPDLSSANPNQRRATFTITASIDAALPPKARSNSKN